MSPTYYPDQEGLASKEVQVGGQHIPTDLSLLKEGLGPPVSAWALPWANNDKNACRDYVPSDQARVARCPDRAALPFTPLP